MKVSKNEMCSMERVWKCDLCGKLMSYYPCHLGKLELCNSCGIKIGKNLSGENK